jgi:hypothetical protein
MRSAEIHPEVDAIVRQARRRMSEGMYRKPWSELTEHEQLDARGRIGYIEALVTEWLERDTDDRDVVVDLILQAVTLPNELVAATAAASWSV